MSHQFSRSVGILLLALAALVSSWSEVQAQPNSRRGGRGPFGRMRVQLFLSTIHDVHRELRFTGEQVQFVEALHRDLSAQASGRRTEAQREVERKLFATLLDRRQVRRFEELQMQFEGLLAFDRESVRKKLDVKDEQHEEIRNLLRSGPSEASLKTQLTAVLSKDQLAQWEDLYGDEFEFPLEAKRVQAILWSSYRSRGRRGGSGRPRRPESREPEDEEKSDEEKPDEEKPDEEKPDEEKPDE